MSVEKGILATKATKGDFEFSICLFNVLSVILLCMRTCVIGLIFAFVKWV